MKKIFTRILLVVLAISTIMPTVSAINIVKPAATTNPDPATVKAAIEAFKNLSKKEKKERFKEVKKALKDLRKGKRDHSEPVAGKVLQIIFAILIPPLGVFLHEGVINSRFWIDLLLTILFFLPGMIYALVIVLGD